MPYRFFPIALTAALFVATAHANVLRCQLMLSDSASQEIESTSEAMDLINKDGGEVKMNYGLIDILAVEKKNTISIRLVDNNNQYSFTKLGQSQAFVTYPVTADHLLNVGCVNSAK